jgi:hypothetical protein
VTRREAIRTLERRLNYLRAQLATIEQRPNWRGVDFIRAEVSALEFALGALEDAEAVGLIDLGRLSVEERAALRAFLESRGEAA